MSNSGAKRLISPFHLSSYFSTDLFPTCLKKITSPSKSPQTCCISYPSDSPLIYLCNKTRWKITNWDSLKATFPPHPTIFLTILFSSTLHLFLLGNETKCHTHIKRETKLLFSICISIFMILDRTQEDKNSRVRCNKYFPRLICTVNSSHVFKGFIILSCILVTWPYFSVFLSIIFFFIPNKLTP
jgi:hypothetical protein